MAVAETKAAVKRYKNTTLEPKDLSFEELRQMTNDFSQSQEIRRAEYIRISDRSSQEFVDLTVKNWSKRLQQTFSGSRLELCCHQVKKCMEVAFRCVEEDRHERPDIVDVIYALNEIGDTIDWMEDDLRDKDVEDGKTEGSRGMPWLGTGWFWGLRWWLSRVVELSVGEDSTDRECFN